jgi:vacuolar-type H+-ATPase subunit E/Vma4
MNRVKPMEMEAQLIERAVEERNQILQNAKSRADKIKENAENEVERINGETERQVLNIVGSELRAVRDRIVGQAELQGRVKLMEARVQLLNSIYNEAENTLKSIAENKTEIDYGMVLIKLIKEAVDAIGGDRFTVKSNERDNDYFKKNLNDISREMGVNLELDNKPIENIGGVVIGNKMNNKIFQNTLDGRLVKVKSMMAAEIAEIIGVI